MAMNALNRSFQSLLCNTNNCLHLMLRSFSSTTCNFGSYKRFEGGNDSVKQSGVDKSSDDFGDIQPLDYNKTYGTTSFPTLETHSQIFDGMKFTDVPVIYIKSTSNNTIISVTRDSKILVKQSAGTVGFKNSRKGTNVAAQAAAIALASDALRKDVKTVRVCVKGIGPGRLPALKALQISGLNIISITDTTPLPFNGCRPKKVRRL